MRKIRNIILNILVIIFTFNVLIAPFVILNLNEDIQNTVIILWLFFTWLDVSLMLILI